MAERIKVSKVIASISWLIVAWISKVFLSSIPYKFSNHPDTQHIFGTIGQWMQSTINVDLGTFFINYGAYIVGSFEILVSITLLLPIVLFLLKKLNIHYPSILRRDLIHSLGGFMATAVMTGAAFFHLCTPLGVEVLHNGQSDHGSLFYAAVSIVILGFVLGIMNLKHWKDNR